MTPSLQIERARLSLVDIVLYRFDARCTTIKMILRDTAQTLTEAVTKSIRLVKCLRFSEVDVFIYGTINRLAKLIHGDSKKISNS